MGKVDIPQCATSILLVFSCCSCNKYFIWQSKGFNIEYLTKVPEVKDTVHKHSLLHHLCNFVMDKFPNTTDLYAELGSIARCAKVCHVQKLNYTKSRL